MNILFYNYRIQLNIFIDDLNYFDDYFKKNNLISNLNNDVFTINLTPNYKTNDSLIFIKVLISNDYTVLNSSSISTKFLCIKELIDNIDFNINILLGYSSIDLQYIVRHSIHTNKYPYIIGVIDDEYILREYEKNDFKHVYNHFHHLAMNNKKVFDEYMLGTIDDEEKIFRNSCNSYELTDTGLYGLYFNNTLIGQYGLIIHNIPNDDKLTYELSYYIDRNYRRKGITFKAIKLLIKNFYDIYDDNTYIYCKINKANTPAISFASNIGFNIYTKDFDTIIMIYSNH